tara:strand:+ start:638 stop:1303 length:666 start_codon:yes stop_codon:yes gene_type:complete
MRNYILYLILIISTTIYSQKKSSVYYDENDNKLTEKEFFRNKEYSKNLDLYFENDSIQFGILVRRYQFGTLDKYTFEKLKSYLTQISEIEIDSTKNIVINYLSSLPEKKYNTIPKSTWNILDTDYLKKLYKIAEIEHFWISSPRSDNLIYYHQDDINWLKDKEDFFKNVFFPYEIKYGNYILIKPDGSYYYYLGEYSKYEIWEKSEKYFLKQRLQTSDKRK